MTTRIILACRRSSEGADALAALLDCPQWKGGDMPHGSLLVNWGHSSGLEGIMPRARAVLNRMDAVYNGIWKRRSYRLWAGNDWAIKRLSVDEASNHIEDGGKVLLRWDGMEQGNGMKLWEGEIPVDRQFLVPVYNQTHEWRVHVMRGRAIRTCQKKQSRDGIKDSLVRSYGNGWVFSAVDMITNDFSMLHDVAIKAVQLLGMSFGAVDIMSVVEGGRIRSVKVCEVNSAPGHELFHNQAPYPAYAEAIKQWERELS